jgi:hypothetical protein
LRVAVHTKRLCGFPACPILMLAIGTHRGKVVFFGERKFGNRCGVERQKK